MKQLFSGAVKVHEEKDVALDRFDGVFKESVKHGGEGYFLLSGKEDAYMFVIGGHPYGTGVIESDGPSFLGIKDFFTTYQKIGSGDISFYKTDRKLLQCVLVYFYREPSQRFTADLVDMEKVLNALEGEGSNCIIKTLCKDRVGFSVCINGKVSFNYFPDGIHANEQPKDALLLYILEFKGTALSIEIFNDISLAAASDAISPKKELPPSLTAHYLKRQDASVAAAVLGEISILLDNKAISKFSITKPDITIGRIPGNDIILDNPAVSRQHAIIKESDGKFIIEDKGSANGTFVNGEKIAARELKDDDKIQIMKYTLAFKQAGQAKAESKAEESGEADRTVMMAPTAPKQKETKLVLENGREITLKSAVLTIGSNDNMDLKLEGMLIGGHHASILMGKGGAATLTHKGSFFTATKVNGESIEHHLLKNDDIIEIGKHKIRVQTA